MSDLHCPTCGLGLSQHEASQHLDWWVTRCLKIDTLRPLHYSHSTFAAVTLVDVLFRLDTKGEVIIRKGEVLIPRTDCPSGALRVVMGDFPLSVTKAFLYMKADSEQL